MSPSSFKQVNGLEEHSGLCSVSPQKWDELIGAVNNVGEKLDSFYMHVVRWLLVVVCAIALGSKLLEVLKGFAHQ